MLDVGVALKLDLGCGSKRRDGYVGVDIASFDSVEQVDLLRFPWPWETESVRDVYCSHFFEHVPGQLRGFWMDELWRVLVIGGRAEIIVPTADSPGAIQDFTHEWPPICRESFMYFNRDARRAMGVEHYPVHCHFEYRTRVFHDVIPQMHVELEKRA